jgi:hypothetical protein
MRPNDPSSVLIFTDRPNAVFHLAMPMRDRRRRAEV